MNKPVTNSDDGSQSSHQGFRKKALLVCFLIGLAVTLFFKYFAEEQPPKLDRESNRSVAAEPTKKQSENTETTVGSGLREGSGSKTVGKSKSASPQTVYLPATAHLREQDQELAEVLSPEQTGWQTEAFNDAASAQLKQLAKLIEHPDDLKHAQWKQLLSSDFRCQLLRPANRQSKQQPGMAIETSTSQEVNKVPSLAGSVGLTSAIKSLPAPGDDFHIKFKIVGVQPSDEEVSTQIYAEGGGEVLDDRGRVQWRAHWNCTWTKTKDRHPLLKSITVDRYEQVQTSGTEKPWFVDQTQSILGQEPSFQEQISQGMDYWISRVEGRLGMTRLGHHGLAVGDVNGDGREDLYVCQPGGLPNRLYLTQQDGTARDIAAQAGVDFLDDSTCALLIDLDNDGDADLVVLTLSGAVVLSNDGNAAFQLQTVLPDCRNTFALTAADYNGDRRLDIYIGRYWPDAANRGEIAIPVPYYDAENGGRNVLLKNQGNWQFEDVTEQVGLDVDNTRFTMAAAWEDIDNDGDDDLYVANDFGRNCLYRNDQGKFVNIAAEAGVEDIGSGMSVSFADYDHNGRSDIYISNMFSSAGNRITYQRQYGDFFQGSALENLQRMARGNSLFQSQSDGTFLDASLSADVTMGRWAWGALFVDINNDAWDDLVVLNGFISTDDTGDL